MAVSGLISIYNLLNIKLKIVSYDDIFANFPAKINFEIEKKFFLPSLLIRIELFNSIILIPYLDDRKIFSLTVNFSHRGKISIDKVNVSSYFPFYFFKRILTLPLYQEIIVFPKPIRCDLSFYFSEGQRITDSKIAMGKAYEGDISGIKNYNPTEPLKYIHWKASAKSHDLMSKDFSPFKRNPVMVKLSDFSGNLEEKLGKVTFTIMELHKRGIPVGLSLENETFKPDTGKTHLRRMLNALALY